MKKTINGRLGHILLPVLAVLCLFAIAACGRNAEKKTMALDRIRNEGVIKVGYANEAPYAFYDNEKARLTGEAPEIVREIAKRLGVSKVEGVLTEFGSLIPGLKAKRFDVIAAGMYITPKRCKEIAFTDPTYKIGEAFLVRAGNPLELHGYDDVVANPEARLGVVAGAVELGYARASGVPDERIAVLSDPPSAVDALLAGRIDAYGGTSLTVNDLLGKLAGQEVEKADPFTDPVIDGKQAAGYGAFGIRKEDKDLIDAFNGELGTFIGSERHRRTVRPFGFTETELPGDVTAAELCGG